jgi:hypothetical protein
MEMKNHLNMLPAKLQTQQLVRCRLRQWGQVWAIAAVAAALFVWVWGWSPYQESLAQVQTNEPLASELERVQHEIDVLQRSIDRLRRLEETILSVKKDVPAVTFLGVVSRSARETGGRVFVTELSCVRKDGRAPAQIEQRDAQEPPCALMTLKGVALDNLSLSRFVSSLGNAGVFASVELNSTNSPTSGSSEQRAFVVECSL